MWFGRKNKKRVALTPSTRLIFKILGSDEIGLSRIQSNAEDKCAVTPPRTVMSRAGPFSTVNGQSYMYYLNIKKEMYPGLHATKCKETLDESGKGRCIIRDIQINFLRVEIVQCSTMISKVNPVTEGVYHRDAEAIRRKRYITF